MGHVIPEPTCRGGVYVDWIGNPDIYFLKSTHLLRQLADNPLNIGDFLELLFFIIFSGSVLIRVNQ